MTGASPAARVPTVLPHIVSRILPPYPNLDTDTRARVQANVIQYVAEQIDAMPTFLRLPYKLALLAFQWLPLLLALRPFTTCPAPKQLAYLGWWSDGPVPPTRDFVKVIRSCALLAYFDHPLVMQELEAERMIQPRSKQSNDSLTS